MAKDDDSFTRSGMGYGPSEGIVNKKVGSGQTIKSAYPQDNVSGYEVKDEMGGPLGGGDTYLGHSLKGASAVIDPHKSNRGGN